MTLSTSFFSIWWWRTTSCSHHKGIPLDQWHGTHLPIQPLISSAFAIKHLNLKLVLLQQYFAMEITKISKTSSNGKSKDFPPLSPKYKKENHMKEVLLINRPRQILLQLAGRAVCPFFPTTSAQTESATNINQPFAIPAEECMQRCSPAVGTSCILRGHESQPNMSKQLPTLSVYPMIREIWLLIQPWFGKKDSYLGHHK